MKFDNFKKKFYYFDEEFVNFKIEILNFLKKIGCIITLKKEFVSCGKKFLIIRRRL